MSDCIALEFEVFARERPIADRPPVYFDTGSHSRPDLLAVNSLEPAPPVEYSPGESVVDYGLRTANILESHCPEEGLGPP